MVTKFTFDAPYGRSGRRRLVYATFFVLIVCAVDIFSGGSIRARLQGSFSGLYLATAQIRSVIFDSGYFMTHRSLAEHNSALQEQLYKNAEKAAAYDVQVQENNALRALVHLSETEEGITAPIVSSVRSSPYGTFLIGAGASDPIQVGSLVLTEGGFVVGKISEVREKTSLVLEIFGGGSYVDMTIQSAQAVAEGRGGGNARVAMPRGIEITVGDVATSPSLRGRPIGLVGKIETSAASAEQTVYVRIPVNLSSLTYVYVVPAE